MPEPVVWPILHYRNTHAARRFLADVLGFIETLAVEGERGEIAHCEMRWPTGGGIVFGAASHTESVHGGMQAGASAVYIATDDVNAIHRRAHAAGTEILESPATVKFGSGDEAHAFTARDFEGNLWTFGTYRGSPG